MASDEEIKALAQLTLRNQSLLDVAFGITNDFACLIEPGLERCSMSGCKRPVTVEQVETRVRTCDTCAARAIVKARRTTQDSPHDTEDALMLLRSRLADDDSWTDVIDADRIRRLTEYVSVIKRDEAHALGRGELQ